MRKVLPSELEDDFEREVCWGDDERHLYYPDRRKSAVFGHFLRIHEVLQLVDRFSPGKRVADFACAQGNFALLLAERGYDVTAIDLHETFLRYAKKKYTSGNCQFLSGNIMEYQSESPFDCILLGEVLEHVAHPLKLLQQCYRNLKPGGVLILTTPNGNDYSSKLPTFRQVENVEALIPRQFHHGDHLFLYTLDELRELFAEAKLDFAFGEKYHSAYVSQIKGLRYLIPYKALTWLEIHTRHWKKHGKDSANHLMVVGRRSLDPES